MCLRFRGKLADLNAVSTSFKQIGLRNASPRIIGPDLFKEDTGILLLSERSDLNPQDTHPVRSARIAHHLELDLVRSISGHSKSLGARQ